MERRKRPRTLTLLLPDKFKPFLILDGIKYNLQNFTDEGIGVYIPSPLPYGLHKGNIISGDIEIGNEIYGVKLEVIRHRKEIFGLKIIHKTQKLKEIFDKLLEPTYYASNLKLQLKEFQNGIYKFLFIEPNGSELLFWCDKSGEIQLLQLCWLGKWLFRDKKSIQTGILKPKKTVLHYSIGAKNELLIRHSNADKSILEDTLQFLFQIRTPFNIKLVEFVQSGSSTIPIKMLCAA